MVTAELLSFVHAQATAGMPTADIAKTLLGQGWSVTDINEALNTLPKSTVAAPVLPPPLVVEPPPPVVPVVAAAPKQKSAGFHISKTVVIVAAVMLLIAVGGLTTYAYMQKWGPFARAPYTEENLLSGLLAASAGITSSSYAVSGSVMTEAREADATPFAVIVSNEAELRQQYQNDYERMRAVSHVLTFSRAPYSVTMPSVTSRTGYDNGVSGIDPKTKASYQYQLTDNGQNFAITVTFETDTAIAAIKKSYNFSEDTTRIEGKTVTFTKDSPRYLYLRSEPPEPWFRQLEELTRVVPAEMRGTLGVTAAANWDTKESDWTINGKAEGDFGDLTYKINVDALKTGEKYYFRINNMPSLFGQYASLKGKWVEIDTSTSTAKGNHSHSFGDFIPEAEESYKESRAEWATFIKRVAVIADEEKLIRFKSAPKAERVDGQLLYRYDLEVRKEAIVPFYKRLVTEANENKSAAYSAYFNDPGMLNYLESAEFSQIFDYYTKNTSLVIYVDTKGYPALIEHSMRLVPPDSATQLKDKQVRVTLSLGQTDINKRVEITAPEGARPFEEITDELMGSAREKGTLAALKANLSSLRAGAEIYYDTANTYAKVNVPAGPCKATIGTLFADTSISQSITASAGEMSNATCAATASAYAISVPLPSDPGYSWCVDSTGNTKQIQGSIRSTSCN